MLLRLADEQPPLALLVVQRLPLHCRRHLRESCRALRPVLSESITELTVSGAELQAQPASYLSDGFMGLQALTLRQDHVPCAAFLAIVGQQLSQPLGTKLQRLRVELSRDQEALGKCAVMYHQIRQMCARLPRLTESEIARYCWEMPTAASNSTPGLTPGLRRLYLHCLSLGPGEMPSATAGSASLLSELHALQYLSVSNCGLGPTGPLMCDQIALLPILRRLELRSNVTPLQLGLPGRLTALQHLRELLLAVGNDHDDAGLAEVAKLTQLTQLRIRDRYNRDTLGLTRLRLLRDLTFTGGAGNLHRFGLLSMTSLTGFTCLLEVPGQGPLAMGSRVRSLSLASVPRVAPGCLASLTISPGNVLEMDGTADGAGVLGEAAVLALAQHTTLQELSCRGDPIDPNLSIGSFAQLAHLTRLTRLSLLGLTDARLGVLHALSRLGGLLLDGCQTASQRALVSLMASLPKLTHLQLSKCARLPPIGMRARLCNAAGSLQQLEIGCCFEQTKWAFERNKPQFGSRAPGLKAAYARAALRAFEANRHRLPLLQSFVLNEEPIV